MIFFPKLLKSLSILVPSATDWILREKVKHKSGKHQAEKENEQPENENSRLAQEQNHEVIKEKRDS